MPHSSVELWSLEDRKGREEEDARRYPVPGTKNGAAVLLTAQWPQCML